jgi:hypothetical protein
MKAALTGKLPLFQQGDLFYFTGTMQEGMLLIPRHDQRYSGFAGA